MSIRFFAGALLAVCGARQALDAQESRPATTQPQRVDVKVEAEYVTVTSADRPILKYRYEKGPKPYIKELYTPGGIQLLLDSPPDHVHHRGTMFAVGVDDVDFWSEGEANGKQVHDSLRTDPLVRGRDDEMILLQGICWETPRVSPLLTEMRRIDLHRDAALASGATLLTWRSILVRTDPTPAKLGGAHYFGLGLRFVPATNKNGKFTTSDASAGEVVRGDEKLYSGKWCAYTAIVDGKPVTVAMFDSPDNPRPATWFTMADPFAYLSATLKLHKEPMKLAMGDPLRLAYGIAAWDGAIAKEQIDKTYQLWLEQLAKAEPGAQKLSPEARERLKRLP